MEPREVWVKLSDSTKDPFTVEIEKPNANINHLKGAIKGLKKVEVEFIYLEDGNNKCRAGAMVLSHDQVGKSDKHPYYYTIEPPVSGKD